MTLGGEKYTNNVTQNDTSIVKKPCLALRELLLHTVAQRLNPNFIPTRGVKKDCIEEGSAHYNNVIEVCSVKTNLLHIIW